MGNLNNNLYKLILQFILLQWRGLVEGVRQYWFRMAILSLVVFVLLEKDLSFQFDLSGHKAIAMLENETADTPDAAWSKQVTQSIVPIELFEPSTVPQKKTLPKQASAENLANTYSNMLFEKKKGATKGMSKAAISKLKKQEKYVARFREVAQSEMKKYGIPASIKLAQGLIESNAGESRLSLKNNNHFGIKCFSKKCKKGHCSNFTDDSHKDFFRKYQSSWESYRAHSIMLNGKRYKHLQRLGTDYKSWALGLKKAGYATDKRYAEKLIHLIERLDLDQYDRL